MLVNLWHLQTEQWPSWISIWSQMTIHGCQYRILWAQQKRERFSKHKCACFCTPMFVVNTEGTSQVPHKEQQVPGCAVQGSQNSTCICQVPHKTVEKTQNLSYFSTLTICKINDKYSITYLIASRTMAVTSQGEKKPKWNNVFKMNFIKSGNSNTMCFK